MSAGKMKVIILNGPIGNYKKCSECKMIVLVWLMDNAWVYDAIIEGIKHVPVEQMSGLKSVWIR